MRVCAFKTFLKNKNINNPAITIIANDLNASLRRIDLRTSVRLSVSELI